ncbi:MAG: Na(+)-translocating NADH-quinone reductase subunit C [bacterium]|nr:Na(+)-translocating NADH-quinone reductase subunit C [bacterium]
MLPKDSIANTLVVSLALCVVCSLLVSTAAVGLKKFQVKNKALDQQRNILAAAGLTVDRGGQEISAADMSSSEVEKLFEQKVTRKLLDIDTGEYIEDAEATFDPRKAAKDPERSVPVDGPVDIGQARREKRTWVFLVQDEGKIQQYIVPIYGMGLWSTLYGYVAVDNDLRTIQGLTFYEHGETPGLGGEVENPKWKSKWVGKQIYEDGVDVEDASNNDIRVGVAKGAPSSENAKYMVDGLSGATITSRGVDSMLKYWFSDEGFGPYFKRLASQQGA